MELYIAVLLGSLIYLLLQLNLVFSLAEFRWRIFIKTNIVPFVLNIVIGFTCVIAREDLVNIYPITFISSVILGGYGQAIWKKISFMWDKKTRTSIGVNK
jgi:hypothetical protein